MDARRALIVAGFVIFVVIVVADVSTGGLGMLAAIVCWVLAWRIGKRQAAEGVAPPGRG